MTQLVVHVKREGAERPEPAYAVWVSDKGRAVRALSPDWEAAAARVEARLRSWLPTRGQAKGISEATEPRRLPQ